MAFARILHVFSNGDEVSFEVSADESFPDVVREVVTECRRMYDEVMVERP